MKIKNLQLNLARATLCGIVLYAVSVFFRGNYQTAIWGDEGLMLFVANHSPLTKSFFKALCQMSAGMPWGFFEYSLYMDALRLVPFPFLIQNLEALLRFPLTVYTLLSVTGSYFLVKRLSNSTLLAGTLTILLFIVNQLSSHLGSDLRFHSSFMAYASLSWAALAYVLTSRPSEIQSTRTAHLVAWFLLGAITGWTHVYGIYNLVVQTGVFAFVYFRGACGLTSPSTNKRIVLAVLVAETLMAVCQSWFYLALMEPPIPKGALDSWENGFRIAPAIASKYIFPPSFWIWLLGFAAIFLVARSRAKAAETRQGLLAIACLGLAQLVLMILLSAKCTTMQYTMPRWQARYMMAGIPPFLFSLSYLCGRALSGRELDRRFLWSAPVIWLAIICLQPIRSHWAVAPPFPATDLFNVRLKLSEFNGYGRVRGVMGLKPSRSAGGQHTISGTWLGHAMQLYAMGPFAISKLTDDHAPEAPEQAFGGLSSYPCAARERFPVATREMKGVTGFLIDFCDEREYAVRALR